MDRADHAKEIRFALTSPRDVCERLELLKGRGSFQRQATGLTIRCPMHGGLSCSVTKGPDGTIRVRCFGCEFSGDVLSLIAAARGLNIKRDFREVLREGAELAGLWGVVQELETGRAVENRPRVEPPRVDAEPPRDYPPLAEVTGLWDACVPVSEDAEVSAWLASRALDANLVEGRDLARALPKNAHCPRWAAFRRASWSETGHRLIVPMRSVLGAVTSVRAGRVVDGDSPKRLPPGGHKASMLVMADDWGVAMLAGARKPERVVIVEGEPDFISRATTMNDPNTATIGIVSGSWVDAFAERFPVGAKVVIRTDLDPSGERYAAEIARSLRSRCFLRRLQRETACPQ